LNSSAVSSSGVSNGATAAGSNASAGPLPVVATAPAPPAAAGTAASGTPGDPAKARELVQAIPSDFYNVSDPEGRPIAGLLVLLDSKRRPVRAELHLGGSTTDEAGRQAIRQAQHILEERYTGLDSLPLQVWQSFLRSEPLHVPLPPAGSKSVISRVTASTPGATTADEGGVSIPWRPLLIGAGALLAVLLIWWAVSALRGNGEVTTEPGSGGIAVPLPAETSLTDPLPAEESLGDGLAGLPPSGDSLSTGDGVTLPPSLNADPEIVPGRRVRMVPTLEQSVLDRPGTNVGQPIAQLGPDTSVMVVGGPTQLPGDADTIVWFEVDLGTGTTGWVAANTSTQPLLELAD
jgi:hypothetical protein